MQAPKITLTLTWHILVIGFFVCVTCIGLIAFGGFKLYQKVLATEAAQQALVKSQEQERLEQEEKARELLLAQQGELMKTKEELEKTKSDNVKTQARLKTLTEDLKEQSQKQDVVITSQDLGSLVTGVVQIVCASAAGIMSGSGSLFTFKELKQAVLTNHHVVKDASRCVAVITDTANSTTGMFALESAIYTYNQNTDEAILGLGRALTGATVSAQNYNYSLASLRKCPSLLPVGTPVVIIGFPAYAKRDAAITIETIGKVSSVYRTATNGIISGYDTSAAGEANYFVSAKIDSGNSGGAALAKDKQGLCMLGLPTWLTVGNYETQGLVQNINNLLPKE